MTHQIHRIGVTLVAVALALCVASTAYAARQREDSAPQGLQDLWAKLDDARGYRCLNIPACPVGGAGSTQTGRCARKDYAQLLLDYRTELPTRPGETPESIFLELAGPNGFGVYLTNPLWKEEASWGLQETLNELMTAQLAQGNERLLQGLRTRFPGTGDPSDPDQLTLLTQSVGEFAQGVDTAIEQLRLRPAGLRARDNVIPTFPFWVENAAPPSQANGEVVESDLNRLNELVYRRGIANNALGKRKFFFGNVNPAGRRDAADELKRSAQATYLNAAVLAVVQTKEDFHNNNGHELKRPVVDAQKIFEDILAGFNPLVLLGDFVPRASTSERIAGAISMMVLAKTAEGAANTLARQFDTDQNSLNNELQAQKINFVDRISALTGTPTPNLPDLTDPNTRLAFLAQIEANLVICVQTAQCRGELGARALAIQTAEIDSRIAIEEVRSIPERIRIEEERQDAVSMVVLETGEEQASLTVTAQIAESIVSCQCGTSSGVMIEIGKIAGALFRGAQETLRAFERSTIEGINSTATIKQLLLQQIQALIAVERAQLVIEARRAELRQSLAELGRAVGNFVNAQQNLSCAYFSNPAYRLQLSQAQRNAETTFDAAMVQSYFAAKALEYEWAERLENPISCDLPQCPAPIGQATLYNPITRSESVFASASAGYLGSGNPEPSLDTFLRALRQWDSDLRQDYRLPSDDGDFPLTYSMRKDILEFQSDGVLGSPAEQQSIMRFRDFLAQNREPGTGVDDDLAFNFALRITDQTFFPARPNLKLKSIKVNLVPRDGFSLRSGGTNPPLVALVMRDVATLRTFFASYPTDDDLLHLDLEETVNLADSRFGALMAASVGGFPVVNPDTTLENLSPAVSRWMFWIDMGQGSNQDLILENLADIELSFDYRFNAPQAFAFPGL